MDTIDTGAEDPCKLEAARKEDKKTKNLQTLFKGTKKNPFFAKMTKSLIFSNFSCRFLNPNDFFQFEL